MLVITDNASEVIRTISNHPEQPAEGGLRIATQLDNGTSQLVVQAAPAPEDGDRVLEKEGARLFLEPDAAEMLDDKILDAKVSDDGAVQFMVAAQPQ